MSISSPALRKAGPSAGNGATVNFPFAFKVFATSDVVVTQTDPAGVETVKTLAVDYTVNLNADQNNNPGGTVVMVVAPPTSYFLTVSSGVPQTQTTAVANGGGWYPAVVNDALDRLTMLIQDVYEKASRAIKVPISSTTDPATFYASISTVPAAAASAIAAASAAGASQTAAAGSASAAATSAGNASTSASSASTSASSASTSASNAATSAANASTSASSAGSSATLAASYLTPVSGTSATSNTVGTGNLTFATQTGLAFVPGHPILIVRTSAPTTVTLTGTVVSYNSGTGSLVANITAVTGAGTFTDWTLSLAASAGAASSLVTGNSYQVNSLGVGTGPSGTAGDIKATTGNFSGTVTAPTFAGAASSAGQVAIAAASSNATYFVTFSAASSGNNALNVDTTSLQYNPSTDTLTIANITGNASTATTASALTTGNGYRVNSLGIGIADPGVAGNLAVAGGAYTKTVALTFGATVTLNCQLSNCFRLALTGNVTTLTVSNPYDGQVINVRFVQDATGTRTVAWPAAFKWAGGSAPVLSTAANAKDFLSAQYDATDATWNCSLMKGMA